ncbi:diaminobutyrate acetyltransferase [Microlunatus sp. Y2014]|uniref:diaminobutyrate acetyltransferase n=1 Tax=Microlunatus sp. Y2014 TaxID=3418488 RepID=UPI003DA72AE2
MPVLTTDDRGLRRDSDVELRHPTVADGAAMWRMAGESKVLDVNASYAYLLWARDFAATSVIAADPTGEPCGFVTGYRRPDRPDTLMIWQVAVDVSQRGKGLARQMLDHLTSSVPGITSMETTITADNAASIALFSSYARGQGATVHTEPLFATADFPDGHDAEELYRISPIGG